MGALFALLSSLSWGTSDFLGGRATARHGALRVLAWSQLATLLLLWVTIAVLQAAGAADLEARPLLIAALGGVAGVSGLAMFYSALARGPMSIVPPIAATGVALPVIVGLVRGDAPGVLPIVGLALAVAGVVLASVAPGDDGTVADAAATDTAPTDASATATSATDASPAHLSGERRADRAGRLAPTTLLLALGAAVGFALIFVALDAAAGETTASAVAATGGARIGSTITIIIALLVTRTNAARGLAPRTVLGFAGIGILDSGANLGFAIATVYGQLEVVAVLASLYPAITSGLAALVLGERISRLQLVGVVVAFGGIALLAQG